MSLTTQLLEEYIWIRHFQISIILTKISDQKANEVFTSVVEGTNIIFLKASFQLRLYLNNPNRGAPENSF